MSAAVLDHTALRRLHSTSNPENELPPQRSHASPKPYVIRKETTAFVAHRNSASNPTPALILKHLRNRNRNSMCALCTFSSAHTKIQENHHERTHNRHFKNDDDAQTDPMSLCRPRSHSPPGAAYIATQHGIWMKITTQRSRAGAKP